ncbi:MAG: RsmD family RNA methyltransferase [Planctomycetaceae bacterium]|jgi:16S rRNA (guanine(966)-N(2))-methyltransferase RsmD|nr:RsmD family RNA methyltransferase [Planctomycetaceae bacterium]
MKRDKKNLPPNTETTVFDIGKPDTGKQEKRKPESKSKRRNVGSEPGMKEPLGLRIIGGKFRGRKLQYVGDNRVRPMKDRVREAVFNLIGPAIKGMYVIDLFGGTGAIAIEAVSRGAASATIIEIHLPTASLLKQNLEMLDLLPICQLHKTDAFFWVKNETEHPSKDTPWIVFCSPPYDFYVSRQADMLAMLNRLVDLAPAGSMFVIESDDRFDLTLLPRMPESNRIRSYPPAVIAIFAK